MKHRSKPLIALAPLLLTACAAGSAPSGPAAATSGTETSSFLRPEWLQRGTLVLRYDQTELDPGGRPLKAAVTTQLSVGATGEVTAIATAGVRGGQVVSSATWAMGGSMTIREGAGCPATSSDGPADRHLPALLGLAIGPVDDATRAGWVVDGSRAVQAGPVEGSQVRVDLAPLDQRRYEIVDGTRVLWAISGIRVTHHKPSDPVDPPGTCGDRAS